MNTIEPQHTESNSPEATNSAPAHGEVSRRRGPMSLLDLLEMNPLAPLFETFPSVAPHLQSARWGLESAERLKDGSQVVRFNLAGFRKDEVKVSLNTALARLTVSAEARDESAETKAARTFHSSLSVTPGTTQEQLTVKHEDGILSVFVSPSPGDREHTVDIPVS